MLPDHQKYLSQAAREKALSNTTALQDRAVDTALLDKLFDELAPAASFEPTDFFGEITISSLGPDKFDETALASWHLAVRPLSFDLKSATGALHGYEKIKLNKDGKISENSGAGRVLKALRDGFGDPTIKPTSTDLIGRYGWFRMAIQEYGKDNRKENADGTPNPKFGQTIKAGRPSVMLQRSGTPEEIAQYVHGVVTETSATFTADEAEAALSLMEGKKSTIYTRGIMRNEDLSQGVKEAILAGDMATYLVESGLAVEEDGVLLRVED